MSLTFVSLYSGAGGLDLGFARAGFTPVFANDHNADAVATYSAISTISDPAWHTAARRFRGHTVTCGDATEAAASLSAGVADVVIGGPPCQGFSNIGRQDPTDERSQHVFRFLDIVEQVSPRAFVMENVPTLGTGKRWVEVRDALLEQASRRYRVELVVLDASLYGVPQRRKRMFLIGLDPQAGPLALPATQAPISTRTALGVLPRAGEAGNDGLCTAKIVPAKKPILRPSPYAGFLFNGQGRVLDLDSPALTLPASMGGNHTPIIDEAALYQGATPWIIGYHRHLSEGGKPLSELPPTVPLRRLTVQEAAVLQTFPSDMPWQGSRSSVLRQIGNAVPPLLSYAVAQGVLAALALATTATHP